MLDKTSGDHLVSTPVKAGPASMSSQVAQGILQIETPQPHWETHSSA